MIATILGSVIVGLFLSSAIALAIWKIYRDKKSGRSFCGGNCSGCACDCHAKTGCDPRKKQP
ncbi:MAG: FeoB-associated Cys-rich membrane protein [Oscillospiraceae bacterium]|nr:FeoB-associated Cys-rich membrane protein [Oscillospiraceae bacterium]